MHLTDEQWALLQPLFPPPSPRRGRPPLHERSILDGILWKLSHNAPWYDLPSGYPSHQTCYRRYRLWKRTGLFQDILRLLYQDLAGRGGFDLRAAFASDSIRVEPVGSRWSLVVSPELQGAWQLPVARIFAWMALKKVRSRLSHRNRLEGPALSRVEGPALSEAEGPE